MNSIPTVFPWLHIPLLFLTIFNISTAQITTSMPQSHTLTNLVNQIEEWKSNYQIELEKEYNGAIVWILCFLAAFISSAGGVGGGPLFIPILNLVAGLKLKTATTYSAFMVTGVMLANVLYYLFFNRFSSTGRPLINYDIALLSEPAVLLGVSLGVVFNVMFPEWLINALFVVFLLFSTYKTCNSGIKCWDRETKEAERMRNSGIGGGSIMEGLLLDGKSQPQTRIVWKDFLILALVWICFGLLHVIKESWSSVVPCGVLYWVITLVQIPLAAGFTLYIVYGRGKPTSENPQKNNQDEDEIDDSLLVIFPVAALITGMLSGLFGIGGGLLLNPLLLQMGVPPQTAAATSTFMLLFSSSMSMTQYILLGMTGIKQASIYASICFVASAIGLTIVQKMVRTYGRVSLIIFSVTIVMGISTIVITAGGVIDVLKQYMDGEYMGFKYPC